MLRLKYVPSAHKCRRARVVAQMSVTQMSVNRHLFVAVNAMECQINAKIASTTWVRQYIPSKNDTNVED